MSTLKTTNLQHASAASPAIVLASDGTATAQLSSLNDGPLSGARNRIINGDMRIDQRNNGASVTISASAAQYIADRFIVRGTQASKLTAQQSTTAPTGFSNSLLVTSSSAYSVTASDYFVVEQRIEGFNVSDLAFGSASAKQITLSFWVRSSLTGTFGGAIGNSDLSRTYPFSYSISSANAWEQKTVTIAGDTTGTWLTNNGIGLTLFLGLGAGSSLAGTAGAWSSSTFVSATGATSVVGTNGATFYITGVQLEAGSVATPFERRSYGQELALCQRYYYRITPTAAQKVLSTSAVAETATVGAAHGSFPVTLRTSPTSLEQSGTAGDYQIRTGGSDRACSVVPAFSSITNEHYWRIATTVASGQTTGQAGIFYSVAATGYLAWSAEL